MKIGRVAAFGLSFAVGVFAVACSGDGEEEEVEEPAEAGPRPPRDAGTGGPAREAGPPPIEVDCPVGTAVEVEDNGTPATANEFTELAFCGVLGEDDVDYATFTTPEGKKLGTFQAVINGKVDFELSVNGGPKFGPAETARFTAGKYLVKAFEKDKKPGSYRFRIVFDPL